MITTLFSVTIRQPNIDLKKKKKNKTANQSRDCWKTSEGTENFVLFIILSASYQISPFLSWQISLSIRKQHSQEEQEINKKLK